MTWTRERSSVPTRKASWVDELTEKLKKKIYFQEASEHMRAKGVEGYDYVYFNSVKKIVTEFLTQKAEELRRTEKEYIRTRQIDTNDRYYGGFANGLEKKAVEIADQIDGGRKDEVSR